MMAATCWTCGTDLCVEDVNDGKCPVCGAEIPIESVENVITED